MHVRHLSLANFRNYARLELDLPPGIAVVSGDNAAGKSNLLEALYYLATAKSFRATSDRDLIYWLARDEPLPYFRVVAELEREGQVSRLEVAASDDSKLTANSNGGYASGARGMSKRLKVNGVAKRALDFIGLANVVMFSPQDMELVDGPPLIRRRYLDVTISQVDPRYVRALAHYNRVLTRRNHLLRLLRDHSGSSDQMVYWDQELARAGAYILSKRQETIGTLSQLAADFHRRLTASQERLRAIYRSSLQLVEAANGAPEPQQNDSSSRAGLEVAPPAIDKPTSLTEAGLREVFSTRLQQGRTRDISYGATLLGPHRDDVVFLLDERAVSVYASRGQQRTVVLALKLAETQYLRECTGEPPILLLDDVLSELDRDRRSYVLSVIEPRQQVLITTTDPEQLEPSFRENCTLLRVERGTVAVHPLARLTKPLAS